MKLQGRKILITGGAGFIGSHIADYLLKEKVKRIFLLDNFIRGTKANITHYVDDKRVEVIKGDIRNLKLVNKLCQKVDYVYHQAAIRLTECAQDPRLCQEVMINGTFNVLEACAKNKVKKLVMASSASVYGESSYLPMDEKHPYNNTTAYGAAKIANEYMALSFHHMYNLPIMMFRYFNVYGPRMDILGAYTEVMIKWLDRIDAGEPPIIYGDGKQSLDFVYVKDVARINILGLKSNISWGIYNVGTGKTISLRKLAETLLELSNSSLKPIFKKVERPYVQKRQADAKKAEKDLGFKARTSLKEGLKELIKWRKQKLAG